MSVLQAFGQTGPGQSMHIQHLDGGLYLAIPPIGAMAAETTQELLTCVGTWLEFKPPRKRTYPRLVKCPVGAALQISRVPRPAPNEPLSIEGLGECPPAEDRSLYSYLMTVQLGPKPYQKMRHSPGDVLDIVLGWAMTEVPKEDQPIRIEDVRVQPDLAEEETAFVVSVEPVPPGAALDHRFVLRNERGNLRFGLGPGQATAYLLNEMAGASKGYFAATLEQSVLVLGPRLEDGAADF